jgi:hypothetical protein
MRTSKLLLTITLIIAFPLLLFSSCREASKIDVQNRLENDIQLGLDKIEILKYIDTLEIDGIKAAPSSYIKSDKKYKIPLNGKEVDYDGEIVVGFRSKGFFYCGAFAIFYFDESGKLISHVVDHNFC